MTDNLPAINSMMPSQAEFQMLQVIAKNAQDSGLYSGVGQQAKIFMVLLAARELGISPMLALNGGIWNINGKIEISARLMNGLIRRAGHSIHVVVSNDTQCVLRGTRSDGDSFECSFTMDDAIKAGLAGSNVWKKYPADMLYNRCMSRLARRLFSDVIGTAYVEGEIRELENSDDSSDKQNNKKNEKTPENLPVAECEDITPNKQPEDHLTEEKPKEVPKISFEQLSEIMKELSQMSEGHQKAYDTYIKNTYNVKEYENLPSEAYQDLMESFRRKKKLEANNANN